MNASKIKKIGYGMTVATASGTGALIFYAAHPWGGNEAYQTWPDYGSLAMMVLWGIAPFLLLAGLLRFALQHELTVLTFTTGIGVIAVLSAYTLIDAIFLHPDAQGVLIFLFLPALQLIVSAIAWLFAVLSTKILRFAQRS